MIWRAVAVWFGLLVIANVNGGLREVLLVRRVGVPVAHALSTLLLAGFIMALAWASIRFIGVSTARGALGVGCLWLVLTLLFEFLAGHYLFGNPWPELFANYAFWRGRLWVLIPVVVLAAPWFAARGRGMISG